MASIHKFKSKCKLKSTHMAYRSASVCLHDGNGFDMTDFQGACEGSYVSCLFPVFPHLQKDDHDIGSCGGWPNYVYYHVDI